MSHSNNTPLPNRLETNPRKRAILDEAIQTFAELGYRGAEVQTIADRVGIGKGTVYRNFGTKEELFWATVAESDGRLRAYINKALEKPPATIIDFLRTVAISYAEFFDACPNCLEVCTLCRSEFRGSIPQKQQELHQEGIAMLIAQLEEGMTRGELKIADPRRTSFAFAALMDGVVTLHCYSDAMNWQQSMVEQMQSAIDIFLEGLKI